MRPMRNPVRKAILASAATLAIVAAPLAFAQGNGNGNGNRGGGKAEQSQRGGGNGNANRGNRGGGGGEARGNRGGGNEARGNRGGGNDRLRGNGNRGNGNGNAQRGNGGGGGEARGNRGNGGGNAARGNGNRGNGAGNGNRAENRNDRDWIDRNVDFAIPAIRQSFGVAPRLIDGCPPGLAKKNNGCLPPGQAKQRYRSYDPGFFGLFGADRGDYRYRDGYLLRYRPDGLAGYIPLLAGALGIGETWPSYYQPRPLPNYYRDYYSLGDPRGYRYADNVIYSVDPDSAAILGVTALLTGSDIQIGSPMPRGYDVYNVPYAYRERYYDRPDRRYRYADGYVYEIDTESALVLGAIQLLD